MVFGHLPSNAALRDQASRAALSVGLNIAEGAALDGAAGKRHFRIARGSAVEVVAAYELAADIGDNVPVESVSDLGFSLARMLTGLIR